MWSLLALFLASPSSFLLFVIGKLEWTKTNCYYFQHLHQLLFYILLGRYISACQTNRRYFYKMNHLLYTDSHWCQFLMHPVYWDIYCTTVITFCLKHIKITRSVFYCSRRGCYWTWAKFWQRNCKAKQRMERRRLGYSCTFCIRFLQQSQNTCIHKNNSSSYVGYLIRGFIYWYLIEELTIVKKYSTGNNKKASAHSPFLQKSVWETFVKIMIIMYTMYKCMIDR